MMHVYFKCSTSCVTQYVMILIQMNTDMVIDHVAYLSGGNRTLYIKKNIYIYMKGFNEFSPTPYQ